MLKIKKGDNVEVIAGKDLGKRGTVLSVDPREERVVVSGVHMVTKHIKANGQMGQKGDRIQTEGSIHMSNVAVICPETDKPTRVGFNVKEDGTKERIAKKSGKVIK